MQGLLLVWPTRCDIFIDCKLIWRLWPNKNVQIVPVYEIFWLYTAHLHVYFLKQPFVGIKEDLYLMYGDIFLVLAMGFVNHK